jgi:hypothetical protein
MATTLPLVFNSINAATMSILLYYYIHSDGEHPDVERNTHTAKAALILLKRHGLVETRDLRKVDKGVSKYGLTKRGEIWVQNLLRVPFPEQSWQSPIKELNQGS